MTRHGAGSYPSSTSWTMAAIVGWALVLDRVITIEWSMPYCNHQHSGPGYAAFGLLPYERFSGVSSLVYDLKPLAFLASIGAMALMVFLAAELVCRGLHPPAWSRRVAQGVGLAGLVLVGVFHGTTLANGYYHLVGTLHASQGSDQDYRPVAITFLGRHYDCTPSGFWFGELVDPG